MNNNIFTQAANNDTNDIVSIGSYVMANMAVTISSNGHLQFWDFEKQTLLYKFDTHSLATCLNVAKVSYLLAVGSRFGQVRIYDTNGVTESKQPKLVYRGRVHKSVVKKVSFDGMGRYMMSASEDGHVFLYDVVERFSVIGYVTIAGQFAGSSWQYEEQEDKPAVLRLYILTVEAKGRNSLIYRYELPLETELTPSGEDGLLLSKTALQQQIYKIDDYILDFVAPPLHLTAGRETFYLVSKSNKIKVVTTTNTPSTAEKITFGAPIAEYSYHQKGNVHISLSNTREWILTWAPDGFIAVRSLLEPDKVIKVFAHDPYRGGVRYAVLNRNCRYIFSVGQDGLLRRWDWKYSASGRRIALEAAENAENLATEQREISEEITNTVNKLSEELKLVDEKDSEQEETLVESLEKTRKSKSQGDSEKDIYKSQVALRVKVITDKLLKAMDKNANANDLEKIDREEFIIDFEERDRLIGEADNQIRDIRKDIEENNLKKHVVRNRIKKECWDSMDIVGHSIKSFNLDPITNKLSEVTNYPIRKLPKDELSQINKIKRLRRVQLAVQNATKKNIAHEDIFGEDRVEEEREVKKSLAANSKNLSLLYDPYELTTNERRKTQIVFLSEYIQDIKKEFNDKFNEKLKLKQDEITKIEDKNERINSILTQLQLSEAIYHPELDADEEPKRIIEVKDSEVKIEKFITADERKRLDEKRRQEEERMKLQADDNSRQRALMDMMGGKLDDRTEQDEKVELVKPEWMSKPKEDMSDDERKLLKEFEKKMAIYKEEQEKARKALETELRKLQSVITEITNAFDSQLREFHKEKLRTDNFIYQFELTIIKLSRASLNSEEDEPRELEIMTSLDKLKEEKLDCNNEIPEIKKELERCREEFELAVKREKEVDRSFKKEFHSNEHHYDALSRLYKRREIRTADSQSGNKTGEETFNPFVAEAVELPQPMEADPPPLNADTDMLDGIDPDLWIKLVDLRDKKIAAEKEVSQTRLKFNEMQVLVNNITEKSERIRQETDKLTLELNQFLERKFQNTYNLETLFEFKQGQVEVAQAPIVTDYSDAVLIHRNVVEKLNSVIVSLGKSKVDALKEMKDYRKGIHALEWYILFSKKRKTVSNGSL